MICKCQVLRWGYFHRLIRFFIDNLRLIIWRFLLKLISIWKKLFIIICLLFYLIIICIFHSWVNCFHLKKLFFISITIFWDLLNIKWILIIILIFAKNFFQFNRITFFVLIFLNDFYLLFILIFLLKIWYFFLIIVIIGNLILIKFILYW